MAIHERNDGSTLSPADRRKLGEAMKGKVVTKGESPPEQYDPLVRRWNEAFTSRASIIALPESESDVSACINFATKHHLDVAVAGGRHSYYGASSSEGLVIDLRKLNQVAINKENMTVTAGGGCLARDVEGPCAEQGIMVGFGAVSETGIGGLTTGGGVGWLSPRDGLAADNLLSARVALANGEVVTASSEENEDLFWGIRGGGPNFGAVLKFAFKAQPLTEQVFFGLAVFTPDKLSPLLSKIEDLRLNAVEPSGGKFSLQFAMLSMGGSPHMPAFMIFYDGPEEEAKKLAAPIYDQQPIQTLGGMQSYTQVTGIYQQFRMEGFDRWSSSTVHMDYPVNTNIVQAAIEKFLEQVRQAGDKFHPAMFMLDLRDYRKVASVSKTATAYSHRYNAALLVADYRWDDPSQDTAGRDNAKAITTLVKEKLKEERQSGKVMANGERDLTAVYPNIGGKNEKIESVFGANYPRLRELKKKYDPHILWNKWYPIQPA